MSGFVYVWFDCLKKRFYVGSHWGHPDDGYVCSSTWMKQAYKNRPQDFTCSSGKPRRKIVARVSTSREDLLDEEQRWLDMIKPEEQKVRYYNLTLKSGRRWHTDTQQRLEVGRKISIDHTGKKLTGKALEHVQKLNENRRGKPLSNETKRKISEAKRGKKLSPEHIEACRLGSTRKIVSAETRQLLSKALVGKKKSEEHRRNISAAKKGKPPPRWTCPRCSFSSTSPAPRRNHFDSCRAPGS